MGFSEGEIVVDSEFVRFGSRGIRVREIKRLDETTHRVDGHWAPILWFFALLTAVLALGTPVLWIFPIALGAAAIHKQQNPEPLEHWLLISAGGMTNTYIHRTTDGDEVRRLRAAIEEAMRSSSARGEAIVPHVPRVNRKRKSNLAGPWG